MTIGVRRPVVAGALGVVALGIGVYVAFCGASDEDQIRSQIALLAKTVDFGADEINRNPIGRYASLNDKLVTILQEDVRVSIPEVPSLRAGRTDLVRAATDAPRWVSSLDVDFTNVTIKLDDAHTTALVGATAKVDLVERGNVKKSDDRAVDFRFVHVDGKWLIATLSVWPKGEARPD